MRGRSAPALAALLLLAGTACSLGRSGDALVAPAPAAAGGPAPLYVAVGASETAGIGAELPLRDAWPRVLHRESMPRETVFVNLGIPGATVADVLRQSLTAATTLRPDVVTVWLNVNDLLAGVSPAAYERDLERLVSALRRGGATRVLVANTPPLDHLPSYRACRPDPPVGSDPCRAAEPLPGPEVVNGLIADYNGAIAAVAGRTGALLVDLHRVGVEARSAGIAAALVSNDGFHPNSAGYAVVARAFGEVLAASGPLTAGGR